MPNVVVQTIDRLMMNAAAAANTGRQRAASQSSGASSTATGPTFASSSEPRKIASPLTRASAATARVPSTSSLSGGRSRAAEASSIRSGATVIIPKASDANQCCQVVNIDVGARRNNLNVADTPIPESVVA